MCSYGRFAVLDAAAEVEVSSRGPAGLRQQQGMEREKKKGRSEPMPYWESPLATCMSSPCQGRDGGSIRESGCSSMRAGSTLEPIETSRAQRDDTPMMLFVCS